MALFGKILVPTDFSASAEEAARTAVALSRCYDASLTFIHVYEPPTYALPESGLSFTTTQLDEAFAAFRFLLTNACVRARERGARKAETQLSYGFAAREITSKAREGAFDLIVMGTHGRTGLSHLLLGSVAERVVQAAHCPVLTVRMRDDARCSHLEHEQRPVA
jgi:nucleotide-binding universal stress UspA family protein